MRSTALSLMFVVVQGAINELALASGNCSAVDHTALLGPPRNQGDSSWCYAHVAADLLTAHTGQRISAVDLAIQYSTASRRSFASRRRRHFVTFF